MHHDVDRPGEYSFVGFYGESSHVDNQFIGNHPGDFVENPYPVDTLYLYLGRERERFAGFPLRGHQPWAEARFQSHGYGTFSFVHDYGFVVFHISQDVVTGYRATAIRYFIVFHSVLVSQNVGLFAVYRKLLRSDGLGLFVFPVVAAERKFQIPHERILTFSLDDFFDIFVGGNLVISYFVEQIVPMSYAEVA